MSNSPTPSAARPSVLARLDRIPAATRSHRVWLVVLGYLWFFDTMDIALFGYTAPSLREEWGLSVGDLSIGTASTFVGMLFGALIGGRLADRIGRRPVMFGAVLLYSIASIVTAFSPNFLFLVICRTITGVGLQAMLATLMVYLSENFPPDKRGRYVSIVLWAGLFAVPGIAFLASVIVPVAPGAWRWLYVIGAAGGLGLLAIRVVPESVRWLAARGREAEAEQIVEKLEREAIAKVGELPPPTDAAVVVAEQPGSYRELLSRHLGRVVLVAGALSLLLLVSYGFNQWTPILLAERGFDTADALLFSAVIILGAPFGALLAAVVVDRFERKFVLIGFGLGLGLSIFAFGTAGSTWAVIVTGALVSGLSQGLTAVFYTYGPELFPTHVRGSGMGAAGGISRMAGIASGPLVALVMTSGGFTAATYYLAVVSLVLCAVVALGPRTRGALTEAAPVGSVEPVPAPVRD